MGKQKILTALENARKSHELQMHTIASMIKGKEVSETLEVDKHKCEFGKWLYSEDNHLKSIIGSQFYAKLDEEHTRWHSECHKISEILSVKEKKGFISKLVGSNKEDEMKREKAGIYHEQLKIKTEELLRVLRSSQRRVDAMDNSKFLID